MGCTHNLHSQWQTILGIEAQRTNYSRQAQSVEQMRFIAVIFGVRRESGSWNWRNWMGVQRVVRLEVVLVSPAERRTAIIYSAV